MPAAEPLRVVQSTRLGELYNEALRLRCAVPVRGFREVILRPGLIVWMPMSVLMVANVALKLPPGVPIGPWRWLGCIAFPPLLFALAAGLALALQRASQAYHGVGPGANRFAEIRGGRVFLWPRSIAFKPAKLVFCKIEPDQLVPEFHHLVICFRLSRFHKPCRLSMLVDDLEGAEAFVQELIRQSEWGRVG